jgi:Flp pilus assembly protein TadB
VITNIFSSMADMFQNETLSMFQLSISIVALSFLLYDRLKYRNNKLSQRIIGQIGTKKKKRRIVFSLDSLYDRFAHRLVHVEQRVELKLTQANLDFTPKEYSTFLLLGAIGGAILGFVFFPFSGVFKGMLFFLESDFVKTFFARLLATASFAAAGSFFPRFWVRYLASKRTKELESQLQESLMSIADGLQSGLTLNQALKTVGDEMPEPMGQEFKTAYSEMQMGKSFNEAMDNLKKRINIPDFNMAVNAMQIQDDAGGKLEDLLRGMVRILQERLDTRQEIKKTVANQKMVGIILLLAPFFFLFAFSAANEDTYSQMFSSGLGWVLVIIAIISYVIAAWLILGILQYINKGV